MKFVSDFLVLGSGIAGLSFALKAAQYGSVHIVTKKDRAESNTNYAQGGIAAVFSEHDSIDAHVQDTLNAGDGLCHTDAVNQLVTKGPERVRELIEIGVQFTREGGQIELAKEGGHSFARILHAHDLTGKEIENALLNAVHQHQQIHVFEHGQAIDLITEHQLSTVSSGSQPLSCYGAYVLNSEKNTVDVFAARITYLCTGGAGRIYRHTTNPQIATGDGLAMAYLAGARLANLEFMQFHPTAFYSTSNRTFLISEALRGAGANLKTIDGNPFMGKYDPRSELATRDIVARAIDSELKNRGDEYVFLDATHLGADFLRNKFPNISSLCLTEGIDITTDPIPVVPAAHYMCGGVMVDLKGQSDINRLYVGGETAFTGVHGANRLASNSLLEAIVWAHESVASIGPTLRQIPLLAHQIPEWDTGGTAEEKERVIVKHELTEIRDIMWDFVGIVRSNKRLKKAARRLKILKDEVTQLYKKSVLFPEMIELRNMAILADLIVKSALSRTESRGLHYNIDFPEKLPDDQLTDTIIQLNEPYL